MIGRRVLAAVSGAALLVGLAIAPPVQQTDAAWVDPEYGSATFTAATVPTLIPWGSPECSAATVLLVGGRTTIRWSIPAGVTGYSAADIEFGREVNGVLNPLLTSLLGTVTTTGTPSAYTTVVEGGLLSNVLGGGMKFAMRLKGPGGWVGPWLVASVTFPALAGPGTCGLTTQAS